MYKQARPRMTRRQLMQKAALFAAGSRLASSPLANAWAAARPRIELGAQTNAWAIDPARFDTFLDVLGQIKKIGYAGFETGFFNLRPQFKSPEQARSSIASTGLTFFGIQSFVGYCLFHSSSSLTAETTYVALVI